jgi:hypothetical protein
MNFFEQELRKLFAGSETLIDPRFTGRVCLARLTDTTNVKLYFDTDGYHEKYEGISITILNRNEGKIDSAYFCFADILGKKYIHGNPNFRDGLYPHIWQYNGKYEWYAYQPTPGDIELLAGTLDSYLAMFQEPAQGMSQQMT